MSHSKAQRRKAAIAPLPTLAGTCGWHDPSFRRALSQLEAEIFRSAMEDSSRLFETLAGAGDPLTSASTRKEQREACILCFTWFLQMGWIEFFHVSGWPKNIQTPISAADAVDLVKDAASWEPP